MIITGGNRKFFAALIFTSFITSGAAWGQAPATQPSAQQPAAQQKAEQQLAEQKPAENQGEESVSQEIVIPPAPVIIEKNPNSISIPAEDAKPESKYEQRAVVSSTVKVGSVYGYRRDPFTRRSRFHSGVDIKARWGDAVGASSPGVVQFAGWYHGYGNLVIVDHGGGVATYYAHLSSFELEPGAKVGRGTVVGYAGSTGRATSPHLHYEVRMNGNPVNPLQPLALDPSSDYFKQLRTGAEASVPAKSAQAEQQKSAPEN